MSDETVAAALREINETLDRIATALEQGNEQAHAFEVQRRGEATLDRRHSL